MNIIEKNCHSLIAILCLIVFASKGFSQNQKRDMDFPINKSFLYGINIVGDIPFTNNYDFGEAKIEGNDLTSAYFGVEFAITENLLSVNIGTLGAWWPLYVNMKENSNYYPGEERRAIGATISLASVRNCIGGGLYYLRFEDDPLDINNECTGFLFYLQPINFVREVIRSKKQGETPIADWLKLF